MKTSNKLDYCAILRKCNVAQHTIRQLIESHTDIVATIAKKYADSNRDFEHNLQLGMQALAKAIEVYDYTKGISFSVYAIFYTTNAILRYKGWKDDDIDKQIDILQEELCK